MSLRLEMGDGPGPRGWQHLDFYHLSHFVHWLQVQIGKTICCPLYNQSKMILLEKFVEATALSSSILQVV